MKDKAFLARKAKWNLKRWSPDPLKKIVKRVKVRGLPYTPPVPSHLLTCLLCKVEVGQTNSSLARAVVGWAKRTDEGPVEVLLTPERDLFEVEFALNSYPIFKKGRVCEGCSSKKGVELLLEDNDYSLETRHLLSEQASTSSRLSHVRYDRARGYGRVFNNTKK